MPRNKSQLNIMNRKENKSQLKSPPGSHLVSIDNTITPMNKPILTRYQKPSGLDLKLTASITPSAAEKSLQNVEINSKL